MRALMRTRHREAAVMAYEALAETMTHKPRIADRAGEAMPARAAQGQRCVAAPVKEQQRLLLAFDCGADFTGKAGRDETAAHRRFAPQVDRLDLRHVLAAEPGRQRDALVASLARVDLALDRRGCRRQHDRNFCDV